MKRKNIFKVSGAIAIITFLLGVSIGYSAVPSATTWLQSGSLTETANYLVWRDGSNYFVKNGETGRIFSDTNVTDLIEGYFANDTTFHFKQGTYVLTARFLFRECNRITFEGEGSNTIFVLSGSGSFPTGSAGYPWAVFSNNYAQDGSESYDITIKDLVINGNDDVFAEITYHLNGIGIQNCWGLTISNVWVEETSGFGVLVWSSTNVFITNLDIDATGNSGTGNGADGLHIGGGDPHSAKEAGGEPLCGFNSGYGCRNVNINNYNAYGTGDDALAVFDSMYVNIENVLISDSGSRGMELDNNWYVNINNFVVNGSEYSGVQIETANVGGAYNMHYTISNGKILGTNASNNLILSDARNVTVIGVKGFDSPNYAFVEAGTADENSFIGCESWGATTSGYGIIGDNTVKLGCMEDGELQENSKWRNYGTATVASDEWVPHGLGGQSNNVQLTNMVGTYDGVPLVVTWQSQNTTKFQVGVFWTNGTEITDDVINIAWVARR